MTYNIQIAVSLAHNPRWEPELFNLPGIAGVIAAQQPDIVALQEVDCNRKRSGYVNQARWLGEKLGYHFAFAPAYNETSADGQIGHYGNALLSRYPITDFRVEPLWRREHLLPGEPSWVNEPRCCFVARVETPKPIFVLGTHLSTSADQQEKQIPQLVALAKLLGDKPAVLMGDFNTGFEALQPLAGTFNNLLQPAPCFTFPNGVRARSTIDHIWATAHWTTDAVWVVSERNGISDHNPVVADLSLPG